MTTVERHDELTEFFNDALVDLAAMVAREFRSDMQVLNSDGAALEQTAMRAASSAVAVWMAVRFANAGKRVGA